jgi:hypothetical protein
MPLRTRTALPLLVALGGCVQPELLNENITGQAFPLPMQPNEVTSGQITVNSFNNQIVPELTNFLTTGATPLGINVIATITQPPPLLANPACIDAGACIRGIHYNQSRRPLLLDDLVSDSSTTLVGGSFIPTGNGFEIASSAFDLGIPLDAFDAIDAFGDPVAFHLRLRPNAYPMFQYKERFATDANDNPMFPAAPPFDPSDPAEVLAHVLTPHEGIKDLQVGLVVPLQIVPADALENSIDPNDPTGSSLPEPTPWIADFSCDCQGSFGGPMVASHPIIADACDVGTPGDAEPPRYTIVRIPLRHSTAHKLP